MNQEYKNLNIIVIMINNSPKPDLYPGNKTNTHMNSGMYNKFANPKYQLGVSRGDFSESRLHHDKSNVAGNPEMDIHTKNLNKLTRKTPEGYMIIIEQRQFEGREMNLNNLAGGQNNTTMINKSALNATENSFGAAGRNGLSKEVEKIFSRVC